MIFRKMMNVIFEKERKPTKKNGINGHVRVTIPIEIRERIKLTKKDYIEWEIDTYKNTLKGKLIKGGEIK